MKNAKIRVRCCENARLVVQYPKGTASHPVPERKNEERFMKKREILKIVTFIAAAALLLSVFAVLPASAADLPAPPQTGDIDRFTPWIIILAVSAVGIIASVCLFFIGGNRKKK